MPVPASWKVAPGSNVTELDTPFKSLCTTMNPMGLYLVCKKVQSRAPSDITAKSVAPGNVIFASQNPPVGAGGFH